MLTHGQIWTALDRLAALAGLSPSGLAKKSGLDPTTFNKSKRITRDGRATLDGVEVTEQALIRKIQEAPQKENLQAVISADREARHGDVVRVLDTQTNAGVEENVSVLPRP